MTGVVHVPQYKGKGDKCECSNSRDISLLSVVGKLYGIECGLKKLRPKQNVQEGRSNVGLCRVEDTWTKQVFGRCVKSI